MATNYPSGLDDFENPDPTDSMAGKESNGLNPAVKHSTQHSNLNDAVEAIEQYVGVEGSADPDSLTYKLNVVAGGGPIDYVTQSELDATINNLVGSAPGTLDTLGEIADALNDDANFAATLTALVNGKVDGNGSYGNVGIDVLRTRVTADAQPRFVLNANGSIEWGPGIAASTDTNLYRNGNAILKTDGHFHAVGTVVGGLGIAGQTTIGPVGGSGEAGILFGSANDVILYRAAADQLRTGDSFVVDGGLSAAASIASNRTTTALTAYTAQVTGEPVARWFVRADGRMEWGDGQNTRDVSLYRTAADILQTEDRLHSVRSVIGDLAFTTSITGDSVSRLAVRAGGTLEWSSGALTADVTLYRGGADILRSDDAFQTTGLITANLGGSNGQAVLGAVQSGSAGISLGSAGDTVLYRSAADTLRTPDQLIVDSFFQAATGSFTASASGHTSATNLAITRGSSANPALTAQITGDTQPRFTIEAGGRIGWSSGTAVADSTIQRTGVGALYTQSSIHSQRPTANDVSFFASIVGETGPRMNITGSGVISLGDGGGTYDTVLYRSAANVLRTDDAVWSTRPLAADIGFLTFASGDSNARWQITAGGVMSFGPGNATFDTSLARSSATVLSATGTLTASVNLRAQFGAAPQVDIGAFGPGSEAAIRFGSGLDTVLYRSAADTLRTPDALIVDGNVNFNNGMSSNRTSGTLVAYNTFYTGNVVVPFQILANGQMEWGDGAVTRDVNLYRAAANVLQTDDFFRSVRPTAGDDAFAAFTLGEGAARVTVRADGNIRWSDGTNASDTNLYRSGVDLLRTDDSFLAVGDIYGRFGTAAQVRLTDIGGQAGIIFGSAGDTALFRSAANTLNLAAGDVLQVQAPIGYQHLWTSTTAAYTLSPAASEAYLATSPFGRTYHDSLRFNNFFGTPIFERYNGSVWSASTLESSIFAGKDAVPYTIIDGTTYTAARWTWNDSNVAFNQGTLWLFGFPYIAPASSKNILIESSPNGSTWTTRHNSTGSAANGENVILKSADAADHTYLRVTITVTNARPLIVSNMQFMSARPGNQGGGIEYEYPYEWNATRHIGMGGGANTGATLQLIPTSTSTSGLYINGLSGQVTALQRWYTNNVVQLQVDPTGSLTWGPGGSQDTNLYRDAANVLRTDDNMRVGLRLAAQYSLSSQTGIGDYGPGSESGIAFGSAADTILYRSAADTLRTPDNLIVDGTTTLTGNVSQAGSTTVSLGSATLAAYQARVAADVNVRWYARADGLMMWGPGSATQDTMLYRYAANVLGLGAGDTLRIGDAYTLPATDGSPSYVLTTNGSGVVTWQAGGGGGGGADVGTDTIWDAAGDLAVGAGSDTASRLARGTALQILQVNSGGTNIEWTDPGIYLTDGDKGNITVSSSGAVWSIDAGVITNTHINASAAIAYSKLALTGSIVNADINASAAIAYSKLALTGTIVNADINASAAIAYSKLALSASIVNADISGSAAITYSKLALTNSIVNADIGAAAAIAYSKLALTGTIVNADINASAAIALTKLATQATNTVLANNTGGTAVPTAVSYATFRAALGITNSDVSGLGTMSTQNASAVNITGGTVTGITDLAVADGGTGLSSVTANSYLKGNGTSALVPRTYAEVRTDLGLVIGTDVQAYDATLAALAGANWAANSLAIGSNTDTVAQVTFAANTFPGRSSTGNLVAKSISDFGFSLIDDADASAARTTLGLAIGSNVQAYSATLGGIAAAGPVSTGNILYTTSTDTWATQTITTAGRALLDDATASDQLTTLGVSAFAKTILDDADATAARSTLGLVIGTNVQAYDAELAAIAGLTSAADRLPYFTNSGAAALAIFTSAGRALMDDASASDQLTTLGVSTFAKTFLDDADASAVRTTIGAQQSGTAYSQYETHTYAYGADGSTSTDFVPHAVVVGSGETLQLVSVTRRCSGGTPTIKLQDNGGDITGFTGLGVSSTQATTTPTAVTMTTLHELDVVCTAGSWTGWIYVTLVFTRSKNI